MNIDIDINITDGPVDELRALGIDGPLATALVRVGQLRKHPTGAVLGRAGRAAELTMILAGAAELQPEDDAVRQRLGPGDWFGAATYLLGSPAGEAVIAATPVEALHLPEGSLAQLTSSEATALDELVLTASRRARRAQEAPVIAVVPGHADAPVAELGQQLVATLTEFEPGVHLVVRPRPRPDRAWREWIDELRRRHRCVVLVCDEPELLSEAGTWPTTHTCVVVDAARSCRSLRPVAPVAERSGRVLLTLVQHAPRGPYRGTGSWLARVGPVHGHHHLCFTAPASIARFARILDGRANSLILGAGGSRGFAHVGVYRALFEAGIELDFVAGTSIGAVIGGLVAHDWEPARLEHAARRIFVEGSSIIDLGPSPTSLLAGERLAAGFRAAYGEVEIEDLPIAFACTSTELVHLRARVHERGRLWKLSKASGSMPGAAPPVRVEDEVLVDGGILNPLPLELARTRHAGPLIAVNLVPDRPSRRFGAYFERDGLGAWLRGRSGVHLGEVLRRSMQVRATRDIRARRRGDELWITPPLEGVGVFEHKRYDEIVERGYHYTKALLCAQASVAPAQRLL